MTDTLEPSQLRQVSALRDVTPVLIRAARADDRLEANVLAGNEAMPVLFRCSGWQMTTSRSGGVLHLVLDLSAQTPGTLAEVTA
jgi:hypothetical protein